MGSDSLRELDLYETVNRDLSGHGGRKTNGKVQLKVLLADDDALSLQMLDAMVRSFGYEPQMAHDGAEAWKALSCPDGPRLAVLDWMMPKMSGIEVCQRTRSEYPKEPIHLLLLTAKTAKEDRILGLEAGANDFLSKPYDPQELRARLATGRQVWELYLTLVDQITELREAAEHIQALQTLIPICSYCKRVRPIAEPDIAAVAWEAVESFVTRHTGASFSHGICPPCLREHYPEIAEDVLKD